jgi:ubiquinone/menaquinone biosynthesis C-methylase UbiE
VDGSVLYFAPELTLLNRLREVTDRPIVTTDLKSVDVDYPGEDIQELSFPDGSFSVIICNHVLEHVPDDRKALRECARVLKRGGAAVFTIPGDFPRKLTLTFPGPDDNGHYRHYGMDVVDAMLSAFDHVAAVNLGEKAEPAWKVRMNEYMFLCTH